MYSECIREIELYDRLEIEKKKKNRNLWVFCVLKKWKKVYNYEKGEVKAVFDSFEYFVGLYMSETGKKIKIKYCGEVLSYVKDKHEFYYLRRKITLYRLEEIIRLHKYSLKN